jgi:chromosome segregation protein
MIFNGSDNTKPADFAEVTLIFDNSKKTLDIKYDEVSITRRAYRSDKQSEYFINKTLVRRKDVRDLFFGTGLSNTNLSIISQGSVTKIAESRPSDLKELLNDAAGVSRYQVQKDESCRKLDKVLQSLEIFNVKIKELEKQVNPLKKKKEIAEKYFKIKKQLEEIELPIIKTSLSKNVEIRKELDKKISDSLTSKKLSEEQLNKIEDSITSLQNQIVTIDKDLYVLTSKQNEMNSHTIITESDENILEDSIKKTFVGLNDAKNILSNNEKNYKTLLKEFEALRKDEFNLNSEKNSLIQEINKLDYQLNRDNHKQLMQKANEAIITNKNIFNRVYGVASEFIKYDDKYKNLFETGVEEILNSIIVSDEKVIEEIISFLKKDKIGNTFLIALNNLKERTIQEDYLKALEKVKGYIGTLDTFAKTKTPFTNIVNALFKDKLVFDNMKNAIEASIMLGHKYNILTLDGDKIINGFVFQGG